MSFTIKFIVLICFVAYFCGTAHAMMSPITTAGAMVAATSSKAMSRQESSAAASAMMPMASASNSIDASKSGNDTNMSATVAMNTTTTMKPTSGSYISTVTPFAILAAFLLVIVAWVYFKDTDRHQHLI